LGCMAVAPSWLVFLVLPVVGCLSGVPGRFAARDVARRGWLGPARIPAAIQRGRRRMSAAVLGARAQSETRAPTGTLVLGLIGGIASGKSTVSKLLQEHGASVIDADRVAHRVYEPRTQCFHQLVATFGEEIVGSDGHIDRKALGRRVFGGGDAVAQKQKLESIVWPSAKELVRQEIEQLKQTNVACIVLEAALLVEANWLDLVDEVWAVRVERDLALERVLSRNRDLDEREARHRVESQMTNAERAAYCQIEVDNNGSARDLELQVQALWEARVLERKHKATVFSRVGIRGTRRLGALCLASTATAILVSLLLSSSRKSGLGKTLSVGLASVLQAARCMLGGSS